MQKEQSTSVAVANSNHLSCITSFLCHISILVCFTFFSLCLQYTGLYFLHFQVFLQPPGMLFEFSLCSVHGGFCVCVWFVMFCFDLLIVLYLHFFTAILMCFNIFQSITGRKEWCCNIVNILQSMGMAPGV